MVRFYKKAIEAERVPDHASSTGTAAAQEVEVSVLRRERRRHAVSLIAGLWRDREGGPIDGVEYQDGMRAAWKRDT